MDLSVFLWTVITTCVLAYVIKFIIWRMTHRFPPGPWNLPLLGYLPFLSNYPAEDYLRLKEKYGPIFGLRFGTRYGVLLNNFADIKDAFNREEFLDRPPDWFTLSDKHNQLLNMNGWEWKETRKLTVTTLRNLGVGKNKIEEKITEEVRQVISRLEEAQPEAEVNLMEMVYLPLLNVILTIICGRTFDDGERLLKALSQFNEDVVDVVLDNLKTLYYPFLKPLTWLEKCLKQDKHGCLEMEEFVRKEAQEHEKEFDESILQDFMAYYMKDMKERVSTKTSITAANLLGNCQLLIFAGTDTTRITMTWIFLHLAQHQGTQEKIYQEIVRLVGKERMPAWSDKDGLPYTEAFILESARCKTLIPADDPRWTREDSQIGDFFVPKGSMIIGNVWAVHMDKKLWGDPENFRPERFLSQDGKKTIVPDYWIPFLTGKRSCPGAKLANMQLFLFVTSLVQKFRVVPPRSGLSLQHQYNLMTFPEKPVVSFEQRN